MASRRKTNGGHGYLRSLPGEEEGFTWNPEAPEDLRRRFKDELGRSWEVQIAGDDPDPNWRRLNFFVYRERNGPPTFHNSLQIRHFVWFCDRFKKAPAESDGGGCSRVGLAWRHYEATLAWVHRRFPGEICWRRGCPRGCPVPEDECFTGRSEEEFLAGFRESDSWCPACFAYNCLTAVRFLRDGFWRALLYMTERDRGEFVHKYGSLGEESRLPVRSGGGAR
jgi:hypothetical protein